MQMYVSGFNAESQKILPQCSHDFLPFYELYLKMSYVKHRSISLCILCACIHTHYRLSRSHPFSEYIFHMLIININRGTILEILIEGYSLQII